MVCSSEERGVISGCPRLVPPFHAFGTPHYSRYIWGGLSPLPLSYYAFFWAGPPRSPLQGSTPGSDGIRCDSLTRPERWIRSGYPPRARLFRVPYPLRTQNRRTAFFRLGMAASKPTPQQRFGSHPLHNGWRFRGLRRWSGLFPSRLRTFAPKV